MLKLEKVLKIAIVIAFIFSTYLLIISLISNFKYLIIIPIIAYLIMVWVIVSEIKYEKDKRYKLTIERELKESREKFNL